MLPPLPRIAHLRPRLSRLSLSPRQLLNHRWSSTSSHALPNIPIFQALKDHDPQSLAVIHSLSRRSFTYGNLIGDVIRAREDLRRKAGDVAGERVGFLAENSYDYVGRQLFQPEFTFFSLPAASTDIHP